MSSRYKKILVVDDEPLAAAAVRAPLARQGYDVHVFASGGEALDWLAGATPDLIILDVVMPQLSGFDVCRRIRQNHETRLTPVIFLTARDRLSDMTEGKSAGSDLYLVKPVLSNKLVNMVEMFLSRDVPLTRRPAASARR